MNSLFKISVLFVFVSVLFSCKGDKSPDTRQVSDKVSALSGTKYTVDKNVSKVMWKGSKVTGKTHQGTIDLKEGVISMKGDNITGGHFVIDMNTITSLDLTGEYKDYLESHLKGLEDRSADDFFNVRKYPTAKFEITKVTKLANDPQATHLVYGNMTIRDVTKQIGIKAKVIKNGNSVKVSTPEFTLNRTEFGVKYNSPTFFENLKEKAINDDIKLRINLVASATK